MKQTLRSGSGVPMDKTLEKAYNKPTEGPSGIIGVSLKKEICANGTSSCMKKVSILIFCKTCCLNDDNECSLHHKFFGATTQVEERCEVNS